MAAPRVTGSVDLSDLRRAVDRYSVETRRSYVDASTRAFRGVVRRALSVTPPASRTSQAVNASETSARPSLTTSDKERGQNAVIRDILAVFVGIGRSKNRKERALGLAQAKEIHGRLLKTKTPGRKMQLDRPTKYVVSEDVMQGLIRWAKSNVGWLASGWKRGLQILGLNPPAWVGNKDAAGSATLQQRGFEHVLTVTNADVHPKLLSELQRRVEFGQRAQIGAMEREIKAINDKQAAKFSK